ncbi:hypothetical protein VNO77_27206 [Canavalia gladiata]|uniref:Kinesin motor domain-containing protein n=1 Tax=Canavalia gladiata TaxID=3824 RepID=A0AAN9KUY9_CANGL
MDMLPLVPCMAHTKFELHSTINPDVKQATRNHKRTSPGKPPIQIRETSNGVNTLAGSTEVSVTTLKEGAACLEQGPLSRAIGSANMNNQSSRSHAIFTIILERMRKLHIPGDKTI